MLLSGALPVEWQAMTLQILLVVGNGLNGTLPTGYVMSLVKPLQTQKDINEQVV